MEQKPKGTYDLLPNETIKYQALEEHIRDLMKIYGYSEIRTPIFEHSSVFHRKTELSDMVTKETYNFKDKGNRDLTLRPEGTAGVIRAYVENKLYANQGLTKLYYLGPNFRYERPQKGRFRQFYQFGIEAIGVKSSSLDAEVIGLSYKLISSLGLKQVKIKVNSLGDIASRNTYKEALTTYFEPHKEDLCTDCQRRIKENPIRILDCKIDRDKSFVKNAATPYDFLSPEAKQYFDEVLSYLDSMGIDYAVDKRLVRGLDYYGHTVFEVEANIKGFGAQNVLGGGGHYEHLVNELGGPDLDGVGIAFGMERLMMALDSENIELYDEVTPDFFIITFDKTIHQKALGLLTKLRDYGFKGDIDHESKNFKGQLKLAVNSKAKYFIIIGEEEVEQGMFTLKDSITQNQEKVTIEALLKKLGK
ncbi:MAG: histidine--tRNA ligase [Acholeplasmataceae bacterium]|nr:histidine--tRNA ligase [Acholeplasmataceae bacterium]